MTVLDASAVLAYLQGERGADVVASRLDGAVVGAANWTEVLVRLGGEVEASLAEAILGSLGLTVEPVTQADARIAARVPGTGLSLGDRLCLALGERLDAEVLTADRAWGSSGRITQIR